MRHPFAASLVALLALSATVALTSCNEKSEQASLAGRGKVESFPVTTMTMPSGTVLEITLDTALSSESASVGDQWSGTITSGHEGIPVGSTVLGTVTSVKAAKKGDRAVLGLGMTAIRVDGRKTAVHGTTEAIEAGSTRARNLGAIAGSAAAGALVGNAVSGTKTGTVVGAVAGAGVATGVVAGSQGYQVVLKSGTPLTFTTTEAMAVRL